MAAVINFISPRLENAIVLPFEATESVLIQAERTIIGIAASALSVFTLGLNNRINGFASYTAQSKSILPYFFTDVMRIANPSFPLIPNNNTEAKGLVSGNFSKAFYNLAHNLSTDDSFFSKHVFSRVVYAIAAVTAVISRIADAILAVGAVILSVVTLGQVDKINKFALNNLSFPGLIDDLCRSARGFINPHQVI